MFPQDGDVWRVIENDYFEEIGYTSHHPRGAFAKKKRQKGVVTKLLDVIWQVGKSGCSITSSNTRALYYWRGNRFESNIT